MIPRRAAIALGFAAALAPWSYAQDRPRPGALTSRFRDPCGHEPVDVLLRDAVAADLGLTAEQKRQAERLIPDGSRRHSEAMKAMPKVEGAPPDQVFAARERYYDGGARAAATVLTPEQQKRLEQIFLRIEGPLAVARRRVADKLALSAEQVRKVRAVVLEMLLAQEHPEAFFNDGSGGYSSDRERPVGRELREEAGARIAKILTQEQKDAFDALLGEPFDLSALDPDYPAIRSKPAPAKKKRR